MRAQNRLSEDEGTPPASSLTVPPRPRMPTSPSLLETTQGADEDDSDWIL